MIFKKRSSILVFSSVFSLIVLPFFSTPSHAEPSRTFWDTVQITLGLKEETGPRPEETLVAPFADPEIQPIPDLTYNNATLPVNKIPLHMPHRANREIGSWVAQATMDALTLDKDKITNIRSTIAQYFTEDALQEFKSFGQKSNIFSAVYYKDDNQLVSYARSTPLFIRANAVKVSTEEFRKLKLNPETVSEDGNLYVYQWLYEVPATLSLIKKKLNGYDAKTSVSDTQKQRDVTFCLTVTRSEHGGTDGVLISKWNTGNC